MKAAKVQFFTEDGRVFKEAVGDRVRQYQEGPNLALALANLVRVEQSPHSETTRFLAREEAREVLARCGITLTV